MSSQLDAKVEPPCQFIARDGNAIDHQTDATGGVNNVSNESDAYTYMSSTSCDAVTQFDASEPESIADEQEAPVSTVDVEHFVDLSENDVTRIAVETYAYNPRLFYSMERLSIADVSSNCSDATYEDHLRSFHICPTFVDAARPIVVPPTLDGRHASLYLGVKTRHEAERSLAGNMSFAMYHWWTNKKVSKGDGTLALYAVLRGLEQDRASHLAICMSSGLKDAVYHVEGMEHYFPTLNELVDFYCLPSVDCADDIALLELQTA
ncbi:hypothetical protein AAVH_38794, partial [Aphelenchoides avenae]